MGSIVASYAFDSFGGRLVSSSDPAATSDPYSGYGGTMGYFTDWETGLQLLGHRFYDSTAGRFLNRDPMDTGGGINVYGYVSNNPLDMADPSGYGSDGGGHGGGGAGGGASHGGVGGGGKWWPNPTNPPWKGAGGKREGALLGCALGMVTTIITASFGPDGSDNIMGNMSLLCPLIAACGVGFICGIAGACVGGMIPGCLVGMACGVGSALLSLVCESIPSCLSPSPHTSTGNRICQVVAAGISGCIGGLCGPVCGVGGAFAGGLAGAACIGLVK